MPLDPHKFAALPPTIRRKYFSIEEQYYIANHYTPIILDAADEALYKQYQPRRDVTSSHSSNCIEDKENDWDDLSLDEEDSKDMDIEDQQDFRWLDGNHNVDLKLDDYHAISQEVNTNRSSLSPYRHSFRRGLSLSNVSFRRRSSSSTSMRSPPLYVSNINKLSPLPPPAVLQPKNPNRDSTMSLNPTATHYQDPVAKMKLRVYLASPQKFDEALEFGFPSLQQEAVYNIERPKTSAGSSNIHKQSLGDDTPSLSEDDGMDQLRQDSPRTPIDMTFPGHRSSQKSSTDRSSYFRPRIVTETYALAPATDREMTLKMTLTRPELRDIEQGELAASNRINDKPLEKAPLTVLSGNSRTIWDELPKESSKMKRFLEKLRRRSRSS